MTQAAGTEKQTTAVRKTTMPTRIVPLGTNGFIPTQGRQTMSFLVLAADQAIVLDTGSGVARLLEQPLLDLLQSYPALSIIYSHYHLDHLVGLSYMTAVWPSKPLNIYAPQRPLLESAAEETLNGLIRPPYFPARCVLSRSRMSCSRSALCPSACVRKNIRADRWASVLATTSPMSPIQ
jgi:glyoxylase-like metal-dependent hydrolase (beta-lactamase superfamily II)